MSEQKRFRAKVANLGFRNARWEQDDIVSVTPEEAATMSHHWEPLQPAKDGSDDAEMQKKVGRARKARPSER